MATRKGKRKNSGTRSFTPISLDIQGRAYARTHDTKRFPGWTHPPTSDVPGLYSSNIVSTLSTVCPIVVHYCWTHGRCKTGKDISWLCPRLRGCLRQLCNLHMCTMGTRYLMMQVALSVPLRSQPLPNSNELWAWVGTYTHDWTHIAIMEALLIRMQLSNLHYSALQFQAKYIILNSMSTYRLNVSFWNRKTTHRNQHLDSVSTACFWSRFCHSTSLNFPKLH